jgi:hypothetical protein
MECRSTPQDQAPQAYGKMFTICLGEPQTLRRDCGEYRSKYVEKFGRRLRGVHRMRLTEGFRPYHEGWLTNRSISRPFTGERRRDRIVGGRRWNRS